MLNQDNETIDCKLCGATGLKAISTHLRDAHPGVTVADYQKQFPGAPVMTAALKKALEERLAQKAASSTADAVLETGMTANAKIIPLHGGGTPGKNIETKQYLHEVFDLGSAKAALSKIGKPIPIVVIQNPEHPELVPEVNAGYVYNINELKNVLLGLDLNIPTYVWGHKGCGKSELFSQICARTGRAMMRVQHTINTEESHIVGQWTVRAGATHFELGPLPLAMLHGWLYVADEYDFALPSVLSVYQAVLEGKPLVIKEADANNRIIRPHPNFRFAANGNTNGSGDETGLYQGTMIQNSANYDRFGVVVHKTYMELAAESLILQNQCKLEKPDADNLAKFGSMIREAYDAGKIGDTVSPRALIYAGLVGVRRGGFREGLQLSFTNKLNKVDKEVAEGIAQRIFGS